MAKCLPVIVLRGVVLLPYSELRMEISNRKDKKILNIAEKEYNNELLIVSTLNPLDSVINLKDLPKIGVMAKMKLKMELDKRITRIVVEGIERVNICQYNDDYEKNINKNILTAKIDSVTKFAITPKDEEALIGKVLKELENYITSVSYMSNSILAQISNLGSIAKISDLIAAYLPLPFERKFEYLKTINPYTRVLMVLEDIKKEQEIIELENKIDIEVKKQLDQTQKEYILREKIKVIKQELGEVNIKDDEIEDLKMQIKNLKAPDKVKDRLKEELKRFEMLSSNSPEINMVRNYIDWLLKVPWAIYTKDNKDLNKTRKILDQSHYGLDKIKTRIIEFLAVNQRTDNFKSPIICLVGPPGVGKTSLARSVANSIGRNFVKISVGGVNDEAEILGHRKAYLGASPGRIIAGMKKGGSSNPVFLIDEIDKMTKDYKGDPASALLEVLDKEQNIYFYDNYLEEEYDLSKVMFILTANYGYNIPEALKDRLEVIELSGYTEYEKLDIAKRHLIPKQLQEHGIDKKIIRFKDEVIIDIINYYTKEAGVRELERLIATICRKVVTDIVTNKIKDKAYNIKCKELEKYLGKRKYFYTENESIDRVGVANGLAYTNFGGDILPIEVTFYKGKGNLILTGSLGEVIKESANIALSYIKSHYEEFGIDYQLLENNDIHVHLPEGATPKDGPSAGITLTTALISVLTNKPVSHQVAMTGELTLRGQILPIGGLKEKAIGAHRSGLKKVIIPKENKRDLDEIPKEIKDDLEFILVNEYKDVYNVIYQ